MLKAATSTIMVSTRNITLVWAWMAEKKPILACSQSNTQPCVPMTCDTSWRVVRDRGVVAHEDLDARDLGAEIEQALDVAERAHRRNWHRSRTCRRRRSPPPAPPPSAARRRSGVTDGNRRHELQAVAHLHAQEVGQPAADHHREIVAEALQRAPVDGLVVLAAALGPIAVADLRRPLDRGGKRRARPEVVGLHAAQHHAAHAIAGHGHDLALDRGCGRRHAGHGPDPRQQVGVASSPSRLPWMPSWPLMLDIWRSISTRKPFITAMTTIRVPTPSGDADQREAGDDRDEALLAAGAQVAKGDEALDGGESHDGARVPAQPNR